MRWLAPKTALQLPARITTRPFRTTTRHALVFRRLSQPSCLDLRKSLISRLKKELRKFQKSIQTHCARIKTNKHRLQEQEAANWRPLLYINPIDQMLETARTAHRTVIARLAARLN